MSDKDQVRLKHILEACENIQAFIEGVNQSDFASSVLLQSAVIRQFEIIGEASANLSSETQAMLPQVEWRSIKAFRNLLIHEYFRVDTAQVWVATQLDVQQLHNSIIGILK